MSDLVESPTGSGKSYMGRQIADIELKGGGKVLVVAPKLHLLSQLAEAFSEFDPQIIQGSRKYDPSHNVFVSTLQSVYRRELGFEPTLIIIDEIHFGFSGKMIEKLLDGYKGKLIGLSATPYDNRGAPLKGFDLHINKYDLSYMIENKYLVPPICFQPLQVDLKGIRTTAGDYNQSDLSERFNTLEKVMDVVTASRDVIIQREKAIAFGIDIQHSELLASAYRDSGITAEAIHSKMTMEEQEKLLKLFKDGEIKVLCNPSMLTTGFDEPPTDVVVLARATKSQNLYRQMVGRVLRLSGEKKDAIVLDCANVVDHLGLPTEPIRELESKEILEEKGMLCEVCGSDRIEKKISGEIAIWVCIECGHEKKMVASGGVRCPDCEKINGKDSEHFIKDNTLYIKCSCGCDIEISRARSDSELAVVYDRGVVEGLQKRIVTEYSAWMIENKGALFPFSTEVALQIKAVCGFIKKEPHRLLSFKEEYISEKDGWRLLPQTAEHHYIEVPIEELERRVNTSNTFEEVFHSYAEHEAALGNLEPQKSLYSKVKEQIENSHIEGVEFLVVKRVKNILNKNSSIFNLDDFIPYIESQKGRDTYHRKGGRVNFTNSHGITHLAPEPHAE